MIVTTDQALFRWCPFVRHGAIGGMANRSTFNRNVYNNNPTNADTDGATPLSKQMYGCHCIATECMAWRVVDSDTGYCGLAGKPTIPTE